MTSQLSASEFTPTLPRASYSRLSVYKQCPKQYKLKYIDKLPEPDRPIQLDRSGKPKPSAAERGSWIHDSMDNYINKRPQYPDQPNSPPVALLPELFNIRAEVDELQQLKAEYPDQVHTEQKWYFDISPIGWEEIIPEDITNTANIDYSLLVIIDCMVIDNWTDPDYITARIIDLKSGKSYNNAAKHAAQLNMYAAAAAHKFPDIQEFSLELLYCDEGKHTKRNITRNHALTYGNYWEYEIDKMAKDKYFDARPTASNCRFCPRRDKDKPNRWLNGDGTCGEFIEHPNDKKWREAQSK